MFNLKKRTIIIITAIFILIGITIFFVLISARKFSNNKHIKSHAETYRDIIIKERHHTASNRLKHSNSFIYNNKTMDESDPISLNEFNQRLSELKEKDPGELVKLLDSKDATTRYLATTTIALTKKLSPFQVVSLLIKKLYDPDLKCRNIAVSALMEFGSEASRAIPIVLKMLDDDNDFLRATCLAFMGKVGDTPDRLIPVLMNMMYSDPAPLVRHTASLALNTLSRRLNLYIPAAIMSLDMDNEFISGWSPKSSKVSVALNYSYKKRHRKKEGVNKQIQINKKATDFIRGLKPEYKNLDSDNIKTQFKTANTIIQFCKGLNREAMKPIIKFLISEYHNGSTRMKENIFYVLSHLEINKKSILPVIIDALKSDDYDLAYSASKLIEYMGENAKNAVPVFIDILEDKLPERVIKTNSLLHLRARATFEFGGENIPFEQIYKIYYYPRNEIEKELKRNALKFLGTIKSEADVTLPVIYKCMKTPNIRVASLVAVNKIGHYPNHWIPELIKYAKDNNDDVKISALGALRYAGSDSITVIRVLLNNIKKEYTYAGFTSLRSLEKFTKYPEIVLPPLIDSLKDTDLYHKGNSSLARHKIFTITKFGTAAGEAVPYILRLYKDKSLFHSEYEWMETRRYIIMGIGNLREKAFPFVPELLKELKNDNNLGRLSMYCYNLGKIGVSRDKAIPAIFEAVRNNQLDIYWVSEGIAAFGKEAIPYLRKELKINNNNRVKEMALWSLDKMDTFSAAAFPELISLLEDSSYPVSGRASAIISKIKPDNAMIEELIQLLKHKKKRVRRLANIIFSSYSDTFLPAKICFKMLHTESLRAYAGWKLKSLGKQGIPFLIKGIKEKDDRMKLISLSSLYEIKDIPEKFLKDIKPLLNNKNSNIRESANVLIKKIKNIKTMYDKKLEVINHLAEMEGGSIRFKEEADSAADVLIDLLKNDTDYTIRSVVSYLSGFTGNEELLPELSSYLEKDYRDTFICEVTLLSIYRIITDKYRQNKTLEDDASSNLTPFKKRRKILITILENASKDKNYIIRKYARKGLKEIKYYK